MKQSDRITERKVRALSIITENVHHCRLTEFGKDNRRVYNDLCSILRVGMPDMGGIDYRVTCQTRRI